MILFANQPKYVFFSSCSRKVHLGSRGLVTLRNSCLPGHVWPVPALNHNVSNIKQTTRDQVSWRASCIEKCPNWRTKFFIKQSEQHNYMKLIAYNLIIFFLLLSVMHKCNLKLKKEKKEKKKIENFHLSSYRVIYDLQRPKHRH